MPFTPQDFGQPVMLTLGRRSDRLAQSMREIAHCEDWPFGPVRPFYGFDGSVATRPTRVQNKLHGLLSSGGWGCTMSYAWLVNEFLQSGEEWLTILEDDLWLVDGFSEKVTQYLAHVPDDADTIYVGGNPRDQIKYPPVEINKWVCRPYRVTATHFFMIRRRFAIDLEPWLLEDPQEIMDARIARLHMMDGNSAAHGGKYNVYFPRIDLAGQVMGQSDIAHRDYAEIEKQIWGVGSRELRPSGTRVMDLAEKWRKPQELS